MQPHTTGAPEQRHGLKELLLDLGIHSRVRREVVVLQVSQQWTADDDWL